jgi:hypothetical protein
MAIAIGALVDDAYRAFRHIAALPSGASGSRLKDPLQIAFVNREGLPESGIDLRSAVDSVGSSLVIVSQNLAIVANYCDRVYVVHAGEIVEEEREIAVDGKGLPLRPVAPGGRIEDDAVIAAAAP